MALKCTKTSPPSSFSIKPNPFFSLNHFTLPSANAVHPPFLRFVQAGFASWRHKKTTPSQNRVLNRWWLDCLQDMNTQLFPAPPFFVISSNPTDELFPGRMCVPNIDFLKMQAFFINLMAGRPMVLTVLFQYRFPLFADSHPQGTPRMEGASRQRICGRGHLPAQDRPFRLPHEDVLLFEPDQSRRRSARRAKEPASGWRGPEPYFFPIRYPFRRNWIRRRTPTPDAPLGMYGFSFVSQAGPAMSRWTQG